MSTVTRLTPEARDWLEGRAVTLSASVRHGCCGGHADVPVAEAGPPDDPQRYRRDVVDGVEIYVDERLKGVFAGPVTVALDGWARWRRLVVLDGVHDR